MDTNLIKRIKKVLRLFPQYWKNGELQRHLVIHDLRKYNNSLISALLKDEKIKELYTLQINNITIFKQEEFIDMFRYKQYWANSYTKYSNEIGLSSEGKYLKYNSDVVLDFPYKDCVLEGGMTKEDVGKEEIYYNEIIAKDEIDILLTPKVFTNTKMYDSEGAHQVTEITEEDNLIIKGNNLLALYSLKERYESKIKLIYIDPPYNIGNDSFRYNDRFKHSTWLTFMKSRLEVSKQLLSNNGSIFVQIDSHELAHLKILMDDIFGIDNFVQLISIKAANPAGFKTVNPGPIDVTEYILFYTKNKSEFKFKKEYVPSTYDSNYNLVITNIGENSDNWILKPIKEIVYEMNGINTDQSYQNQNKDAEKIWGAYWKVIRENLIAEYAINNKQIVVSKRDPHKPTDNLKKLLIKSKSNNKQVICVRREGLSDLYIYDGGSLAFYSNKVKNINGQDTPTTLLTDLWSDISWDGISNEGKVKFKNAKKPERLLQRIINLSTEKNDIILDFFMGAATTQAVAMKLGRCFIGIEQMDYINELSIPRLQEVINGEQGGISKDVAWQGGGSFIYTELKRLNQIFVDKILSCNSSESLINILNEMKRDAYLDFKVNIEKLTSQDIEIEGHDTKMSFKTLPLDKQKEILIGVLDKNQLYINYSDIDDEDYRISDRDKMFNHSFYQVRGGKLQCLKDCMKN